MRRERGGKSTVLVCGEGELDEVLLEMPATAAGSRVGLCQRPVAPGSSVVISHSNNVGERDSKGCSLLLVIVFCYIVLHSVMELFRLAN